MQTIILGLLLVLIFSLFNHAIKEGLRRGLHRAPSLIWLLPMALTAVFTGAAVYRGVASLPLILAVLAYATAPVICVALQGAGFVKRPAALDFLAILLLWLPLEFSGAVSSWIPRPAQGFLHSVAYGVAILLGLVLFLCFRTFDGLKYNLPSGVRDFWLPFAGFALSAPLLIAVGVWIGFIPPVHWPTAHSGKMAAAFAVIFAATALPEEILFRSLIQNLLMQRLGVTTRTLILASLIFGAAHLDNGPQPLPNWRYMILATIAGVAYGKVFQKSSTVLASAGLHAMVDWVKHFFF